MSTFSEKLKKGLKEALEYDKGKRTLRSKLIELPKIPMKYGDKEIKRSSPKSLKKDS